ncbi:MAG: glutamate--tRNA ligase, partial [bacterium]
AADKHLTPEAVPLFEKLTHALEALEVWDAEHINRSIQSVVKESGVKFPSLALPLRVAISGDAATPSIDATVKLVGKDRTLARISNALNFIGSRK